MDPQVCRVAFHGAQHGMAENGAALAALLTTDMRLFNQNLSGQHQAAVTVHDARSDLLSPQVRFCQANCCILRAQPRQAAPIFIDLHCCCLSWLFTEGWPFSSLFCIEPPLTPGHTVMHSPLCHMQSLPRYGKADLTTPQSAFTQLYWITCRETLPQL